MNSDRLCSVEGCQRPMWARGWCGTHYRRWRIHGVLTDPDDPAARFARSVAPPNANGCRLWIRSVNKDGYGKLRVGDRHIRAHRWAYEHFVGPIPLGALVCHHCDTPACCEPSHLYLGTPQTNMTDKITRGRARYKSRRKLSDKDVRGIRALAAGGMSQTAVARRYSVTAGMVNHILHGRRRQ